MGFSLQKQTPRIKNLAPRGDLVKGGGYTAVTNTGDADIKSGTAQRHYLSYNHLTRIRQAGAIINIRLYITSVTNLSAIYFEVWRRDGTTFDRIYQENILSKVSAKSINTVILTTPVDVFEGDFIGFGAVSGGISVDMLESVSGLAASTYYIDNADTTAADYDWTAKTGLAYLVPIEVYMLAPKIVYIGDSITAGHTAHYSYVEARLNTVSHSSTLPYQLSSKLGGATYQNMGHGGQTSTEILARFTADVVNLKPRVAVINCGVNDISDGDVTLATYTSNMSSMIKSCVDNDIIPVVVAILPWTSGTDAQMNTRDIWNGVLKNLVAGYPTAIFVDAGKYVGVANSSGPGGNTWDIMGGYDSDGVHFTATGYQTIAQAIYDALP